MAISIVDAQTVLNGTPLRANEDPVPERHELTHPLGSGHNASAPLQRPAIWKYKIAVAKTIASNWSDLIKKKGGQLSRGEIKAHFFVNEKGNLEELKILSNSSDKNAADCAIRAISSAKLPPAPLDISALRTQRLEITCKFDLREN